ncbi:hypothetical protein Taro_040807 [Colocasia esculenta]|uniref:Uncharacterized protein n=1 Tax=Colocasia esculenta TaxID=4460 RepID=A0A843WVL3_COLES|nr:hypothetical protein [Colocasia esculenta]
MKRLSREGEEEIYTASYSSLLPLFFYCSQKRDPPRVPWEPGRSLPTRGLCAAVRPVAVSTPTGRDSTTPSVVAPPAGRPVPCPGRADPVTGAAGWCPVTTPVCPARARSLSAACCSRACCLLISACSTSCCFRSSAISFSAGPCAVSFSACNNNTTKKNVETHPQKRKRGGGAMDESSELRNEPSPGGWPWSSPCRPGRRRRYWPPSPWQKPRRSCLPASSFVSLPFPFACCWSSSSSSPPPLLCWGYFSNGAPCALVFLWEMRGAAGRRHVRGDRRDSCAVQLPRGGESSLSSLLTWRVEKGLGMQQKAIKNPRFEGAYNCSL